MFRTVISVHHQESKTVHTASGICQTDSADCLLAGTRWNSISFPLASSQQNLCDIYLMLYEQSSIPFPLASSLFDIYLMLHAQS